MSRRKLIVAVGVVQLLAAVVFAGVVTSVDAGKFVMFRSVAVAQHEGGDPYAEALVAVTKLGVEFYGPSMAFAMFAAGTAVIVTAASVWKSR